jgi:uncharacterized membrane protein
MEEHFKLVASYIALGIEAGAVLLILIGASDAFYKMVYRFFAGKFVRGTRRQIWSGFGVWLLLGLEFELAADIIRSAISPNWTDIGQLAAIAAIRTGLNYFLEKDIEKSDEVGVDVGTPKPSIRAA